MTINKNRLNNDGSDQQDPNCSGSEFQQDPTTTENDPHEKKSGQIDSAVRENQTEKIISLFKPSEKGSTDSISSEKNFPVEGDKNVLDRIVADQIKPARMYWRKIIVPILFLIALVIFLLWWNLFRSVPLRISKETTYLTEPIRSDGKGIDYLAAIKTPRFQKDLQADENGIKILARSIFCRADFLSCWNGDKKIFMRFCQGLGLNESELNPISGESNSTRWIKEIEKKYPGKENEMIRNSKYKLMYEWFDRDWTPEKEDFTKRWIKDNEQALDLISEACRKEIFELPVTVSSISELAGIGSDSSFIFSLQALREIARQLEFQARARLRFGDLHGAAEDKRTLFILGRKTCELYNTPIAFLIGLSIEGIGFGIPVVSNENQTVRQEDLRLMIEEIRIDRDAKIFERFFLIDRYIDLELIQKMSNGDDPGKSKLIPYPYAGIDWNIVTRLVNQMYDDPCRMENTKNREKWPFSLRSRSEMLTRKMYSSDSNGFDDNTKAATIHAFQEALYRIRCVKNLQCLALAVLLYKEEHGSWPPAYTKDSKGRPLHSWRVLILKYLGPEEKKLFQKIRLDEPWNSPHNTQFHLYNLPVFVCPSALVWQKARYDLYQKENPQTLSVALGFPESGQTVYSMLTPSGVIVERTDPVCWMKPDSEIDLESAQKGINGIEPGNKDQKANLLPGRCASYHKGGMNRAAPDGSVRFLSERIDPDSRYWQEIIDSVRGNTK